MIQGRATIKKNGVAIRTKNGASLMIGGVPRSWVADDQLSGDYQEGENQPGGVECTVLVDSTFRSDGFDGTDLTIEFVADSGQVWVINKAFLTEPMRISNGECQVIYHGQKAQQL